MGVLTQITTLTQNIVYFNRLMCFSSFSAAMASDFCVPTTVMVTTFATDTWILRWIFVHRDRIRRETAANTETTRTDKVSRPFVRYRYTYLWITLQMVRTGYVCFTFCNCLHRRRAPLISATAVISWRRIILWGSTGYRVTNHTTIGRYQVSILNVGRSINKTSYCFV